MQHYELTHNATGNQHPMHPAADNQGLVIACSSLVERSPRIKCSKHLTTASQTDKEFKHLEWSKDNRVIIKRDCNWMIWTVFCFYSLWNSWGMFMSWSTKTAWAAWALGPSMPMQLLEASNRDTKTWRLCLPLCWWIIIKTIRLVWPQIKYSSHSYK